MPDPATLSDEALMTWIVNALMEAQRRGLTSVMVAEPAGEDDGIVGEDGPCDLDPAHLLH